MMLSDQTGQPVRLKASLMVSDLLVILGLWAKKVCCFERQECWGPNISIFWVAARRYRKEGTPKLTPEREGWMAEPEF